MIPYFVTKNTKLALNISIIITSVMLVIFGLAMGYFAFDDEPKRLTRAEKEAARVVVIGGIAVGASCPIWQLFAIESAIVLS